MSNDINKNNTRLLLLWQHTVLWICEFNVKLNKPKNAKKIKYNILLDNRSKPIDRPQHNLR